MTQPAWSISAGGRDFTEALAARFISLTVRDEAGIQSDSLELRVGDPDARLEPPREGEQLNAAIGYEGSLVDIGGFIVDEVSLSGPPDIITVTAKATDFLQSLKSKRTRNWTDTTIGDVVGTIAGEHGLTPAVADTFQAYSIIQADQTNESDIHFLTRTARDLGAVSKVIDSNLVFANKGEAESVSGKALPNTTLTETDMMNWRVRNAERGQYGRVAARYRGHASAMTFTIERGDGDGPLKTLPRIYEDADRAISAANAALKRIRQSEARLSCTVPGNAALQAEGPVTVNHRRAAVSGNWRIEQVEHRFDTQGFVSRLELERPS